MRHRSVQSRAGSLTAAAVLAVGFGVSAAQAGFVLDLKLTGGGTATTVSSGTVVSLDVWGTVTGTGAAAEGLQDAFFGVTNTGGAGDLSVVTLQSPFNGVATDVTPNVTTSNSGTLYGTAGSKSVGSTDSTSADGWVFARSTSMTTVTDSTPVLLGQLSFTAGASGSATLAINARQAANSLVVPAVWQEDGAEKDGAATVGTGVSITIGAAYQWLAGDFNHDKNVDGADFTIWSAHLGSSSSGLPSDQRYSVGDANADGNVDGADFTIWAGQLGQSSPAPEGLALAAVPEPASLGLVGLAIGGLAVRRRRA